MTEFTWNAGKVAVLRSLWANGNSAGTIATILHTTKNSIIGKAHREGLPSRPSPIKPMSGVPHAVRRPDAVARLPELWAAGEPLARICQILALQKSRVLEAAEAMGLSPRAADAPRPQAPVASSGPSAKPAAVVALAPEPAPVLETATPPTTEAPPAPEAGRRAIPAAEPALPPSSFQCDFELAEKRNPPSCRFPIGEPRHPDFRYCGAPRQRTHSYCDAHHEIAFVTIRAVHGTGTREDGRA